MKVNSVKALFCFSILMMFCFFLNSCTDLPTDTDPESRLILAQELEDMQPGELADYISGIDGQAVVPGKAAAVSVYEVLKVIPLLDAGDATYTENISIISFDGVKISANVYAPKNQGTGPFPAVVFINSWGMDEYEYQVPAATLAKKGYVALSYSCRGFGKSGGVVNFAGSIDNADLTAVLDYLVSHFPVDGGRIAAAGISYGGMSSLLALARQPRIKTVAAMSAPADFARALFYQDATRGFWLDYLALAGLTQNVDPAFMQLWEDIKSYRNVPAFLSWGSNIAATSFINQINALGKPLYMSHNFSDDTLISNINIDFYARLTVPKKLDLNQGMHASAEAGGLLGANNYVWNNVYRWFDYHLKGIQNGIMSESPVTMEKKFSSGRDSFEAWPSARVRNRLFYMHPRKNIFDYDGEIKTGKYYSSTLFNPNGSTTNPIKHLYPIADTIATTGIPALTQILESHIDVPVKVLVDFICPVKAIVFKSDRFNSGMKIRGITKLRLNAAFSGGKGLLVAYLYDVSDDGVGTLLTHGVSGFYNKTAGQNIAVSMELAATAYDLPAGHRLAVVIDTVDPYYSQPVNGAYDVTFRFSNSMQSHFEIQTVD